MPNHKFEDPVYEKQRELLSENQEDALQKGLQRVVAGPSTESRPGKRKTETVTSADTKRKKATEWLGVDMDMSDLDSEEDETDSSDEQKSSGATNGKSTGVVKGEQNETPDSGNITCDSNEILEETSTTDSSEYGHDNNILQENMAKQSDSDVRTDKDKVKMKDFDKEEKYTGNQHTDSASSIASENKEDSGEDNLNEGSETLQERKFCLDEMEDIDQVLSFGMDVLKQELMSRGLKCGGTLQQRALRLFSVKGLTTDEIDPALFAKTNGKSGKSSVKKQ